MSEEQNNNKGSDSKNETPKSPSTEGTKNYGKIGESKAQQDILRKGAELTPRPTPPKNDDSSKK